MKFLVDENLAPVLARALDALFRGEHEVAHLRDKFGPNVKDVEWITALSREGRWIIISGDRRITKVKAEYTAFRNSRLIGFFMSPALTRSKTVKQMERILALWDSLTTVASAVGGGAMFELPMKSNQPRQI